MSEVVSRMNLPAHRLEARRRIESLEAGLAEGLASGKVGATVHNGGTEEGDAECDHYFAEGVYARSVLIPAGTAVVGRVHKQSRVCIVAQGTCTFMDEHQQRKVAAPWVGEFAAGSKTCVFAHTDTLWIACVGTDLKDSRTAFGVLSAATYEEYEQGLLDHQEKIS